MQYLGAISKMTEWSLFISKVNHSVSRNPIYASTTNVKEAEAEWFYEDLQDPLGEGNGNPLQYSRLENPMDGGAW